jgi:serine/threonine protein kinase
VFCHLTTCAQAEGPLGPVAIKQLDRVASSSKWDDRLRNELEAHASSHGPRICNLVEVVPSGSGRVFVVMELCAGRQLFDLVANSPGRCLSEDESASIVWQLVEGVQTIHDAGFIHRDLKPENVMVCESPLRVKIVDFGAAKPLAMDEAVGLRRALEHSVSGTTAWNVAPERGYGEPESPAADVWAVGCILFFLLTGNAPFRDLAAEEADEAVLDRVLEQELQWPESSASVSREARHLVQWMLEKEGEERPSLQQVFEHQWMQRHALGARSREELFDPFRS